VKAVEESADPMIVFAREMDGPARDLRKRYETEVEEPERQAYAELANVRFAFWQERPADATFTLRLAYGVVKGYEAEGQQVPFATTFGGPLRPGRAQQHKEPFELPERWKTGKAQARPGDALRLRLDGGYNRRKFRKPDLEPGRRVRGGINFDRNRFGLVRQLRLHRRPGPAHLGPLQGILEALQKLYECRGS